MFDMFLNAPLANTVKLLKNVPKLFQSQKHCGSVSKACNKLLRQGSEQYFFWFWTFGSNRKVQVCNISKFIYIVLSRDLSKLCIRTV